MLMGTRATPEGTAAYARAHPAAEGHYREALGLTLSSIGFGSYLGDETPDGDAAYTDAFVHALQNGVNVLDTAINYRAMRSERAVGAAIRAAGVARDRFLLTTKGGFVPVDCEVPMSLGEQFREEFVTPGIVAPSELVAGCHVMTPRFLAHALDASLRNLGVDAVDVYFVHNPETQLEAGVPRAEFEARLGDVFRMLEEKRREGRIGVYGLATWHGFRRGAEHVGHIPLERVLALAREAGGAEHGMRAVELPFSLAMPEAARSATQPWRGRRVPFLEAAREAGLLVLGSATLAQGRLLRQLPPGVRKQMDAASDVEAAVQFARSTPGLTSALVGTGRVAHAKENVALAQRPPRPDVALRLLGA